MLDKLWRARWTAISLPAIWLLFEFWISWAAFCDQPKTHSSSDQPAEKYDCIFKGPLASLWRAFFDRWYHVFDKPDAYVALFTGVLVVATAALWWSTRNLWRVTNDTLRHAEETAERQLRAYLTVRIGSATYQDRNNGLVFEIRPKVINTGQTPAHNVRYSAVADILPEPLPSDFSFALPGGMEPVGGGLLGPGQDFNTPAFLNRHIADDEVDAIKSGNGKRLYIWGTFYYNDIFGHLRETDFSQSVIWNQMPDGSEGTTGRYERHSRAT